MTRRARSGSKHDGDVARHELAERFIEVKVSILLSYRIASMQATGLIPNMEASITKLYFVGAVAAHRQDGQPPRRAAGRARAGAHHTR